MEEVKAAVVKFTKDRDWDQFHSPANLAKSIAIESGELLECFQWNDNYDKKEVCKELADVVNYAILMGDTRSKGHIIPLSFKTMQVFEDAGFKLKEIIMKEQHNCRATGYWKTNSIKYNFLLLAHEYLFIFRK